MGSPGIPIELREQLGPVCVTRLPRLVHASAQLVNQKFYEQDDINSQVDRMAQALNQIRNPPFVLAGRCLVYMKVHTQGLQHPEHKSGSPIAVRDCVLALKQLDDLLVCFREIKNDELLDLTHDFMLAYRACCLQCHLCLPIFSVFNDTVPSEPPKGKSMRWYKERGWQKFFARRQVKFLSGTHAGEICVVHQFNGRNTQALFSDGFHYITTGTPLTWN